MNTKTLTLTETKARCSFYGYSVKKECGEFRAYPKGQPDLDLFETDGWALFQTVRANALHDFRATLERLPITDETKEALVAWYESHGVEWRDALHSAWINGNYGYSCADSGTLQRLRNTNGHAVIARIR